MMDRNCKHEGCTRTAEPGARQCRKCRYAIRKAKDPVAVAYVRLKSNAKRRGKIFELTLEQFREFCDMTPYMKGKGKRAECYHVDRIDETKGYTIDNIQCITNSDNKKKYITFTYGYTSPDDPDSNERGMWFNTAKAKIDTPEAPF